MTHSSSASAVASPLAGTVLAAYDFAIDASKAREAALALKTTDETWTSASPREMLGRLVPPTFTTISSFQWDRADVFGEQLGMSLDRTLHGSSEWHYDRPVVVGDELHGELVLVSDRISDGRRSGRLRLVTVRCTFRDPDERQVASEAFTFIETSQLPQSRASLISNGDDDSAPRSADVTRLCDPVTRADLVRYAGACGDFSPIHVDPEVARAQGDPDVFAMGLFHGGVLALHAAESWASAPISDLSLRWRDRVWPGDQLVLVARPEGRTRAALVAHTTTGRVVVTGTASIDPLATSWPPLHPENRTKPWT